MARTIRIFVVAVFVMTVVGIISWPACAGQESSSSLEQTFQKAKQDYLDKNMNSASEQIRKGAALMKDQAGKASEKGKEAISASADELDKLADDVKKGLVSSPKRMEDTFARAYLALASNEHVKATESWAQKKRDQAGEALESANRHLEKSVAWAGQKIEKGTNDAMKKSEALARKLKQKGSLISEEVGRGLRDAGREIEDFGKRISPR